jgi:oligopeptide/dipeptide ABC transporter ATP-binding protein
MNTANGKPSHNSVLRLIDLQVSYRSGAQAVRGVTLDLAQGRCLGVVGESGCGKSTIALAVLGLLPPKTMVRGSILVSGLDVAHAPKRAVRALRGTVIGFVAQDPMRSFDPLMSVASSVEEAWKAKHIRPGPAAAAQALERLGITDAERRGRQLPHQWSGGMLQRAAIAAAAAHQPRLIVADEPTTAIDADRAESILSAIRATGTTVLLISHDLSLIGRYSDEVAIMYAGKIVEHGPARQVLEQPQHPYTAALLAAAPRPGYGLPRALPGDPPRLDRPIHGCSFAPRCSFATVRCSETEPHLNDGAACCRRGELQLSQPGQLEQQSQS